jgi:hypothetical protein
MYGNFYDVTLTLRHDGQGAQARRVRVWFTSLVEANISRFWDGKALVDNVPLSITHTPASRATARPYAYESTVLAWLFSM